MLNDTVRSYDEFNQRIYGLVRFAYTVFQPAPSSSGPVGIPPRIISGIFTVSNRHFHRHWLGGDPGPATLRRAATDEGAVVELNCCG